MTRLKSRQMQIPNGFVFVVPQTGWHSQRMASFDQIVHALISHRRANPFLAAKHGWSTEYDDVAMEVEAFNVRVCQAMGWISYLSDEGGGVAYVPKSLPSQQRASELSAVAVRARKIWDGVKTLNSWLDSSDPGVPRDQAEKRAAVCVGCQKNQPGGFESWFTKPAAAAIQRQIEKSESRKLTTSVDDKLNVCTVCLCPLRLVAHVPLQIKLSHLSAEVEQELRAVNPPCWIITEKDGLTQPTA